MLSVYTMIMPKAAMSQATLTKRLGEVIFPKKKNIQNYSGLFTVPRAHLLGNNKEL